MLQMGEFSYVVSHDSKVANKVALNLEASCNRGSGLEVYNPVVRVLVTGKPGILIFDPPVPGSTVFKIL